MDEKRLAEIESVINYGYDINPDTVLELIAEIRRLQSELNSGNKKVSNQLMRQHAEDTSLIGDLMIENATLKAELANVKVYAEVQAGQAREAALKEAARAQCPYCKQERELLKPERALGWMHQPGVFGKEYVPCWSTHIQDLLQAQQAGKPD